jgi:hypothetical protein
MPLDTLTITDNRTGTQYDLPINNGTINASDLQLQANEIRRVINEETPGHHRRQ